MGTGEWEHDPEKRSLSNEDGDRVFRLTVVDDKMEGSPTSGGQSVSPNLFEKRH